MKEGIKTIQILKKIRDASSLKIHKSLIQDTRSLLYKGWSIRDGFGGLVKFVQISRDED